MSLKNIQMKKSRQIYIKNKYPKIEKKIYMKKFAFQTLLTKIIFTKLTHMGYF